MGKETKSIIMPDNDKCLKNGGILKTMKILERNEVKMLREMR
jgi:hypothetical protein